MEDEHVDYSCPACGEINHCDVETLKEEGEAVRDCWVCCRPIVLRYDNGRIDAEVE